MHGKFCVKRDVYHLFFIAVRNFYLVVSAKLNDALI